MVKSVTHEEFESAMKAIKADFDTVNDKLETVNDKLEKLDELERSASATLEIIRSIDQQLKEHRALPARVDRLERAVFK